MKTMILERYGPDATFTLEQAGEAHAKLESGTVIGKVVITV